MGFVSDSIEYFRLLFVVYFVYLLFFCYCRAFFVIFVNISLTLYFFFFVFIGSFLMNGATDPKRETRARFTLNRATENHVLDDYFDEYKTAHFPI